VEGDASECGNLIGAAGSRAADEFLSGQGCLVINFPKTGILLQKRSFRRTDSAVFQICMENTNEKMSRNFEEMSQK
tara:strand:- start:629 stop:856 length:228 start_codon:yes stop_codon:yes gene_type:complete